MVGGSFVEAGILSFRKVGMIDHLDRMQVLKNRLVFCHKLDLRTP